MPSKADWVIWEFVDRHWQTPMKPGETPASRMIAAELRTERWGTKNTAVWSNHWLTRD